MMRTKTRNSTSAVSHHRLTTTRSAPTPRSPRGVRDIFRFTVEQIFSCDTDVLEDFYGKDAFVDAERVRRALALRRVYHVLAGPPVPATAREDVRVARSRCGSRARSASTTPRPVGRGAADRHTRVLRRDVPAVLGDAGGLCGGVHDVPLRLHVAAAGEGVLPHRRADGGSGAERACGAH